MKRSEAYKRIRANIKLQPQVYDAALKYQAGVISWGRLCDFIAEEALKQVEDMGFLPPNRIPSPEELGLENDINAYYEECLLFNEYRDWERE